jgi:hypothetical protein
VTYLAWSLATSLVVIGMEFLFRRGLVWQDNLFWLVPTAILANYLIYRLVNAAPTYVLAFAAFQMTNLMLRSGLSHFALDEPIRKGSLVAVIALAVAIVVGHTWK